MNSKLSFFSEVIFQLFASVAILFMLKGDVFIENDLQNVLVFIGGVILPLKYLALIYQSKYRSKQK